MMLEGVHFDLTYTPLKHLGYKAAITGFADACAMNGYPRQLLVSLGVSSKLQPDNIEELYSGILLACRRYQVDLIESCIHTSLTGLSLSITVVGTCEAGKVTCRNGAQNTDLICLTGNLGAAYMGLLVLEREKLVFEAGGKNPQLDNYEYIIGKYLRPEARKDVIDLLREAEIKPTAMINISKGLSPAVLQLCKQSNVGARIYLEKIPIARETNLVAGEMNFNVITAALNGGEDYELLFTAPLQLHDKIKAIGGIDLIGHIVPPQKGAFLVPPNGEEIQMIDVRYEI
jgi:thiamine-monophosphate kinase